jgi:CRISPR/Cas system endoribonuclease Cas6 (RAMP superfamily)
VMGCCGRTDASEFERMPMSAVERTRYVQTQSAKQFFFFFFFLQKILTQNIHKHKAKNLQNTSTPPPNLICHIAHNVTKCTIPRGRVNLGIA